MNSISILRLYLIYMSYKAWVVVAITWAQSAIDGKKLEQVPGLKEFQLPTYIIEGIFLFLKCFVLKLPHSLPRCSEL